MSRPPFRLRVFLAGLVLGAAGILNAVPAAGADWAVIFMYHRFGELEWPATNIRLDQFESHLEEIRTGGYTVLPLPEILSRLRAAAELPDRTIAITVDGLQFTRLAGGRALVDYRPAGIDYAGDAVVGKRIVENIAYVI